jgi:formylaminopyrimidine deformylase / aminopyrimidine aminohydrolase
MKPSDLLERHAAAWVAATHHPFLDAVREGTLLPQAFATWLVQDYLFARDELVLQARLLARAPRRDQTLLTKGLVAMEAELGWFETQAKQQRLPLEASPHPVTAAYCAFLRNLEQEEYAVALTALWAVELAYLAAWRSAAPGYPSYRPFVDRWTSPAFADFVAQLEHAAAAALASSQVDHEAEAAFLEVARLERAFWEMAWSGAAP